MPTHSAKGGFQWGKQKVYKGAGAKAKANKQGVAIKLSEARAAGAKIPKGKGLLEK